MWRMMHVCAVMLGVAGCHEVFPYNSAESHAGDGPRIDRARADLSPVDGARDVATPDGPRRDSALDAHLSEGVLQRDLPAPWLGQPCGDGKTSPGCCSTDKWCWQSPLPQGNDLNAVFALAPDDIYLVGSHGTILRWYQGQFYREDSGTTAELLGVWGTLAPQRTVVAVGTGGTILTRATSSPTWSPVPGVVGTTVGLRGVFGRNASEIYAVGTQAKVVKYDGMTWKPTSWAVPANAVLSAVWVGPGATGKVYVGGFVTGGAATQAALWSYNGASVTPEIAPTGNTQNELTAIWGDSATIVAAGLNILKRWTAGTGWASLASSGSYGAVYSDGTSWWVVAPGGIYSIQGTQLVQAQAALELRAAGGSGSVAVAAGRRGLIWRNAGASWQQESRYVSLGSLNGIWGNGASDLWAVSGSGEIIRNTDGTWSKASGTTTTVSGPNANEYTGISGSGTYRLAVGKASPSVAVHITGTTSFTVTVDSSPPPHALRDVWVQGPGQAYAATENGVYRYSGTWQSSSVKPAYGVWGASGTEVYSAGNELCYGPTSWACIPVASGGPLQAVWGRMIAGKAHVLAVGYKTVVHGSIGGAWSEPPPGTVTASLLGVWGNASGTVHVVGADGVIYVAAIPYTSMTAELSGTNKQLNAVWAQPSAGPPCSVWAVGDTGTILCKAYP